MYMQSSKTRYAIRVVGDDKNDVDKHQTTDTLIKNQDVTELYQKLTKVNEQEANEKIHLFVLTTVGVLVTIGAIVAALIIGLFLYLLQRVDTVNETIRTKIDTKIDTVNETIRTKIDTVNTKIDTVIDNGRTDLSDRNKMSTGEARTSFLNRCATCGRN